VDKQLPKWLLAFAFWGLISINFLSVRHSARLFLFASLEYPRNEGRQNGSIGVLIFGCKVHKVREACCTYARQTPDQTGF
jgi:hypothetical protein